jgi:hypothetical protein
VQAADADQVRDAGGTEQVPVAALDGGLVAHRQRGQRAGGAGVRYAALDRVAHPLARAVDRRTRVDAEALRWLHGRGTHRAHRAHALLEQPQLVVEACGFRLPCGAPRRAVKRQR